MNFLKNKKRILALIFALVTICLCFTGCGGAEVQELTEQEQIILNSTLIKPSQNDTYRYHIYTEYIALVEYIGTNPTVIIPETIEDKPVLLISRECFADNENIKEIKIPDTLFQIDNATFRGCKNLEKITFSNIMTNFPQDMCAGCTSLKEFNLPKALVTIGGGAFRGCTSIPKITIPNNVTTIANSAFADCTSIEEVIIMDGGIVEDDTLVKINYLAIHDFAFSNLTNVKRIVVPNTVTEISSSAFAYINADCIIYGYVPSEICTLCSDLDSKYKFIEITDGDEIDKLITTKYSQMSDSVKKELEEK